MAYIKLEDLQKFPIRIDHYDKEHGDESFINGVETVLEYAEHLSAADVVEVKHGEWLDVQYTYFGLKRYVCSQCSDDEYWEKRYLEHKESFCPNCGAKMDGGKNENM